jgi:uncharacterized RmlC-like cupin family protein
MPNVLERITRTVKDENFSVKKFEELPKYDVEGQSVLRIIGSTVDAEHIAMSIAVMKPGERILKHNHKRAEEIYVLTKGKSTIIGGRKKLHVEATTFFRFPPKIQREIINDSERTPHGFSSVLLSTNTSRKTPTSHLDEAKVK